MSPHSRTRPLRVVLALTLPFYALAAVTFIADDRIRNPNLTPTLGRGFSLTTYGVLSTCLDFEKLTEPTYNYDYDMMEVSSDETTSSTTSGSFQASMSWGFIRATVSGSAKVTKNSNKKTHYIVTKMAIERYYSSVDDRTAFLTDDAKSLLDKGDTVGFFQACGSGYIRSIRRTAEVTAVFSLESSTSTEASEFAASLKIRLFGRGAGGGSFSRTSSSMSTKTTMKIKIKAFGLGLNMQGADTLVARSLEDYDAAMKFAFKSFQNQQVGIIRGVEIVPWMDSLSFQNAVSFSDMPIVKAVVDPSAPVADADDGGTAVTPGDDDAVIKPNAALASPSDMRSGIEVKAITTINGEFVQMIDSMYRNNLYLLASMRRCVGELEMLKQAGKGYMWLHDNTRFDMSPYISGSKVTVDDVAAKVNGATLAARFRQTQRFIDQFYGPCISAITNGADRGRMVRYWFNEPSCNAKCLRPNSVFKKDSDNNLVCTVETTPAKADQATALDAFTLEGVVERYCMPEPDMLNDAEAKAASET